MLNPVAENIIARIVYQSTPSPPGLLQLIDDIQSSIELGKKLIESTEVTNPVKVTYAIKQLAKEAAVGE